jgi:hypothetical protein
MTDYSEVVQDAAIIWHYMALAKFVSILQNGALWFVRLDCLRDDPFEGRCGHGGRFWEKVDAHTRKGCVNCWAFDPEESDLMWHAYAPGFGVAIQSTKRMLKASLAPSSPDRIFIGQVQYGTDRSKIPPDSPYIAAFGKPGAFKWEQELRVLIPYESEHYPPGIEPPCPGKLVPVQLSSLVAEVWIAPNSEKWFKQVVEFELRKYGLDNIHVKERS